MDAFYASVELLRYPQLKGLPVVIGGAASGQDRARSLAYAGRLHEVPLAAFPRLASYVGRGVITTATYPARAFGVGSAMGMMKAARLCPQALMLPVDFAEYRRWSRRFKEVVVSIAPVMEDRGVDEVYIDLSALPEAGIDGGRVLAQRLQQRILQATGLSCSIGVAPNKLIAKMASEFEKPGGIAVVQPEDLQPRIWPLACRKIHGVGPKTDARLQRCGIHTIGELAARPRAWLMAQFGAAHGAWLHDAAWGRDERPVLTESEPVSMSRETTFERDLHAVHDKALLGRIFTELCEQVACDLRKDGYLGRTIGIKLRYEDFKIVTRDHTIAEPTQDAAHIRRIAGLCLKRAPLQKPLRLLGVRVGSLLKASEWRDQPAAQELALF
ncbi:DNA polymerase IV [Comamonas sp. NLF-1-9]|uniref:Y-family DNA polymerase n=1 Tax=Comamonas sp. NLF-1-9 TaxID=2853163 RepID=UPI001C46AEEE|nr:DNA polymerase IV [Comamonas sp. NLF-1-9]QXL84513.1 DNA polymerase IV [Comamonas sp. NLF-1-9]